MINPYSRQNAIKSITFFEDRIEKMIDQVGGEENLNHKQKILADLTFSKVNKIRQYIAHLERLVEDQDQIVKEFQVEAREAKYQQSKSEQRLLDMETSFQKHLNKSECKYNLYYLIGFHQRSNKKESLRNYYVQKAKQTFPELF